MVMVVESRVTGCTKGRGRGLKSSRSRNSSLNVDGIILVALVLLEGVGAIRGGGGSKKKWEVDGHAWYF